MSSTEEVEIKGGHLPAVKVGGVRISHKTKLEDGMPAKPCKNCDNGGVEFKNPLTAPVMIKALGKPERDFDAVAAVKHTHEKPLPTHEKRTAHISKPSVIQQPRK